MRCGDHLKPWTRRQQEAALNRIAADRRPMELLGRLPASMRAITRSAEAQERSLLSRGVRQSRYKKISPATVQPSPITPRTLRTSLGRVGSVPSSRSGRHLLAFSFHRSPAFSQSACVVGISAATRGVADTLARASATMKANGFMPHNSPTKEPRPQGAGEHSTLSRG